MIDEIPDTILVCGGRNYTDRRRIREILVPYLPADPKVDAPTVVHGGCRGADLTAADVAARLGFWVEGHPANWVRYSKAAGRRRNQRMAQRVARDRARGLRVLCIAFSGGSGTADMVQKAVSHGIPVRQIDWGVVS